MTLGTTAQTVGVEALLIGSGNSFGGA